MAKKSTDIQEACQRRAHMLTHARAVTEASQSPSICTVNHHYRAYVGEHESSKTSNPSDGRPRLDCLSRGRLSKGVACF